MKMIFFLMGVFLFFTTNLFAQDKPATERSQSVSMNLLGLQYNYEIPMSRLTTVNLHGGLGSDFSVSWNSWGFYDSGNKTNWAYSFRGVVGADFRYFYNLDKRARKGRNVASNSGSFLSLDVMYVTPAFYEKNMNTDHAFLIIPAWGLRRSYKSGLYIEPRIGYKIGYDFGFRGWGGNLRFDFKFGYRF